MWKTGLSILIIASLFLFGCGNGSTKQTASESELSEMQHEVMKNNGTEPAFKNEYWDHKEAGIYVDAATGKALFSSTDKYDSGTGWPSFTKAIGEIEEKEDNSYGRTRTEIRTEGGHIGHWFPDGPEGSRYCTNSAALKFVAYEDLEDEGYGEYKELFNYETAIFAGGCFWGVEHLFAQVEGIESVSSGYTGGDVENPTYKEVSSGKTGHAEGVRVVFDPEVISYGELVDYFWRLHDPTQLNKQGWDKGTQYRSAIFYLNEEQKKIAEESKEAFDAKKVFDKPAVTEIVEAGAFYKAEDYHQDYYIKNTGRTCHALRDE